MCGAAADPSKMQHARAHCYETMASRARASPLLMRLQEMHCRGWSTTCTGGISGLLQSAPGSCEVYRTTLLKILDKYRACHDVVPYMQALNTIAVDDSSKNHPSVGTTRTLPRFRAANDVLWNRDWGPQLMFERPQSAVHLYAARSIGGRYGDGSKAAISPSTNRCHRQNEGLFVALMDRR